MEQSIRKTSVGVYVEKEWQYNMYCGFFQELFPNALFRTYSLAGGEKEFLVITDTHRVLIYGYVPTTRGHKHDVVISLVEDIQSNNFWIHPILCNSKFLKETDNEG